MRLFLSKNKYFNKGKLFEDRKDKFVRDILLRVMEIKSGNDIENKFLRENSFFKDIFDKDIFFVLNSILVLFSLLNKFSFSVSSIIINKY